MAGLRQKIIDLYEQQENSNNSLSLRYQGVAARLGSNEEETLEVLKTLADDEIMFKQSGYYALNPPHLWKVKG